MKATVIKIKFLVGILLLSTSLQSCILYIETSLNEVAKYENRRIKIKTNDGHQHKLRWIEIKNDTISSIINVTRIFINKNQIDKYLLSQPNYATVDLDIALISKGDILVRTLEFKDRNPLELTSYNYTFQKVVDAGDHIIGYQRSEKDTVNINLPINNIKEIKKVNKGASIALNITPIIVLTVVTVGIIWITANPSPPWGGI